MYFRYKAYEEGGSVREGVIEGTAVEERPVPEQTPKRQKEELSGDIREPV